MEAMKQLTDEEVENVTGGVKVNKKECNGNVYENVLSPVGKEAYTVYVAVSGDTLFGIASAFGCSVLELQRMNRKIVPTVNNTTLSKPNLIVPGNQIIVEVR